MPNENYAEFRDKFKIDADRILRFVNTLGHGRTETRSLGIYAMRQLIAKHARKQGFVLEPTRRYGKFNLNFNFTLRTNLDEANSELSDYQRVAGDETDTIESAE